LGKYRGPERELSRVWVRQLMVRDQPCLSFVYRYKTKDVTKNVPITDGIAIIRELLGNSFQHAHLLTATQDIQLSISRKGKCVLSSGKSTRLDAPSREHDREKQRFLDLSKPFLVDLGITNEQHQLVPSMSRKWKQINKFVEVLDHALESAGLTQVSRFYV